MVAFITSSTISPHLRLDLGAEAPKSIAYFELQFEYILNVLNSNIHEPSRAEGAAAGIA